MPKLAMTSAVATPIHTAIRMRFATRCRMAIAPASAGNRIAVVCEIQTPAVPTSVHSTIDRGRTRSARSGNDSATRSSPTNRSVSYDFTSLP